MHRAIQRQTEARAPGTNRNYQTAVRHYINYCNMCNCDPSLLSTQEICVFIEYLADFLSAPASIINYVSLVRKYVADCAYNTNNWFSHRVKLALDAVNRDKSHTPRKRPVIKPDQLYRAFKHLARRPASNTMRLIISILYFTALRQSEVILHAANQFDPKRHLTTADITIRDGSLNLYIKHAKNMAGHSARRTVVMAPTQDPLTCPVVLYTDMRASHPNTRLTAPAFTYPDGSPVLVAHVTRRAGSPGPGRPSVYTTQPAPYSDYTGLPRKP